MANITNNEYLKNILNELSNIASSLKKSNSQESTNLPNGSGVVSADAKNVKALGDSLNALASAIVPLVKISKNDIKSVTDNINSLSKAISSIKLNSDNIKNIYNLSNAIKTLNSVFEKAPDSLFKTFSKFNKWTARLIGKRIAGFYIGLFNQIKKDLKGKSITFADVLTEINNVDKNFDKKVDGVSKLIGIVVNLDIDKLIKISKKLKKIKVGSGNIFANFITPILNVIKSLPDNIDEKMQPFLNLINTLSSISLLQIARLNVMAKTLDGNKGKKIGNFFSSFVTALLKNDQDGKKTKIATDMVNAISKILMSLTLSLIGVSALIMVAKENVIFGIVTIGVLAMMSIGIIEHLALISGKSKDAVKSINAISKLLLSLTLSLIAISAIFAITDSKNVWQGLGALAILAVVTVGIVVALSFIKNKTNDALEASIGILLLVGGFTLLSFAFVKIAKNADDTLLGAKVVALITGASIVLLWLLSKIDTKTLLTGILATAGIVLIMGSIILLTEKFVKVAKMTKRMSWEMFGKSMAIIGALVLGTAGVIIGLGALMTAGTAGIGAALFAGGLIAMGSLIMAIDEIIRVTDSFINLISKMNGLDKDAISNAIDKITGDKGLASAIKAMTAGLLKTSITSAIQAKNIAINLKPVFESISMFVDIIQKMNDLKVLDHYDKNGNPVYRQMSDTEFTGAANAVTSAFNKFVIGLSKGLDKIKNAEQLKNILNQLFPRKKLFGSNGSIGNVITAISQFADVIIKIASASIPDQWDSNGNPIHYMKLNFTGTDNVFINAANTVSKMFTDFITGLDTNLINIKESTQNAIENLNDVGITELIAAISNLIDPILMVASGKFKDGRQFSSSQLTEAATTLGTILSNFASPLSTIEKADISPRYVKKFIGLIDSSIDIVKQILSLDGIKNALFNTHMTNFKEGLNTIFSYINTTSFDLNKANQFKKSLDTVQNGVKGIKPYLEATPKQIKDLAQAFKELDQELLTKEEQRSKAIMTVSSNFKDMAESIKSLNAALSESKNLTDNYNNLKTNNNQSFLQRGANALYEVKDSVQSIIESRKPKDENNQQEAIQKAQQEQNQMLSLAIANAITAAMDAWYSEHKDLTVQLSGGQKMFGELYGQ